MGLSTQDSHSPKEHSELYKILLFGSSRINNERDTVFQNIEIKSGHMSGNTFFASFKWLYRVQYWPDKQQILKLVLFSLTLWVLC